MTLSGDPYWVKFGTGHVRWVFQTVHHDLWDYDVPAQPSLVDLQIGGAVAPALVQPTRLSATLAYRVRAYDVSSGAQLWRSRLPAGGQATPMSNLGADGRQYVLVVAGGHGSPGTTTGDSVLAYALPNESIAR